MKMLRVILALLLLATPVHAQGVGQLGSGQLWGNSTASRAPSAPTTVTGIVDRAISSTQGAVLTRQGSAWVGLAPGTVGLPLVSGGAAANLAYGILGLSGGGTNANLTANNGGLFYSTSTAGAILAGTATAGQIPRSGSSAAPSWSTATFPATAAAGTVLGASSANVIVATATPVLGVAGSTVGSIGFANATSGSVTVQPATGALGTAVWSLPAATDTFVGKATTDTLTNKTLVTPALGTPSSGTLTNATGLPISTGVAGLGTGVATALAGNVGTAGSFVVNGGALGSPSSVGTLPAHTLGGTVSGGGNQINNAVIGAVTPLAGSFTGLTITPAAVSINQGLIITQTGPATTPSGPLIYNLVTISNPASVTSPSTLTNGMLDAEVRGFHVEMNDSSSTTVAAAGTFHMVVNSGTPSGDKVAVIGNAYSDKNINGYVLGVDAVASVGSGGNVNYLVAAQFEPYFIGTGTATNRMGVDIVAGSSFGTARQASAFDAALSTTNVGTIGAAFKKGISFGSPADTAPSIDPTGDAIFVNSAMTVANFCNCGNMTVTGNIFSFPNFSVTGAGVITGTVANITGTNQLPLTLTSNVNLAISGKISNNSAGTGAFSQWEVSNGTNGATFGIAGVNATPALYTGRAYATGNGTGILVGSNGAFATVFIVSNAEVGRWDHATPGQLDLGLAGTTVGKLQFNNATSGSITIAPPTGALGSAVLTLPDVTATVLTTSNPGGAISTLSNSLSGDVALNNTANYFAGPVVVQGTSGTWFATANVTVIDTAGAASIYCKLWDGTTIISSGSTGAYGGANSLYRITISGVITSPAGNIRMDCRDISTTSGAMLFNSSGNSKDSSITAIRIN